MALPKNVQVFTEPMDPYDILDYEVDVTSLLQSGESVTSYTVSLPTESSLLGLEILTTAPYSTSITGNVIRFYLGVIGAEQANAAFSGEGAVLPIEISINTNTNPPRRKQRTVAVVVRQR